MNHVYRVVFNHALKCVQVVSEFARGRNGVTTTSPRRIPRLAPLFTGIALACMAPAALAIDTTWVGVPGDEWNVAGNWSAGVPTDRGMAPNDMAYVNSGGVRITGTHVPDADEVHIANTGAARLDIFAGGRLDTNTIFMATQPGSLALVTINGPGSQWNARYSIGVGHFGTGDLSILNGGSMTIDRESYIASMGGSTGIVRIQGIGSTWNTGNILFAGQAGNGTLEVTGGGLLNARDTLVGNLGGSVGQITVSGTGSHAEHAGQLVVGNEGRGTYLVAAGGSVNAGNVRLGINTSSRGDVTVSGTGTTWTSSSLSVGESGQGSLTVTDGAVADVGRSIVLGRYGTSSGSITIGPDAAILVGTNTTNAVIFDGAGSSHFELAGGTLRTFNDTQLQTDVLLSADSSFDVDGNLTVTRGLSGTGKLSKVGTGTLALQADNSGWTGALQVNQGTLNLAHSAALGGGWLGMADGTTLGLSDGVSFNNSVQLQGDVAISVVGNGSATLAGSVSGGSNTTLIKRDAGTLTLGGGTTSGTTRIEQGTLRVTGNALGGGNVEIGPNTTLEIDTTRVLSYAGQFSGQGNLRQGRHFMTLTGDSSAFAGTTQVNGGLLEVNGKLGGLLLLDNAASLAGNGSVGDVFVLGGSTLAPGSRAPGSIGTLSITGDLVFENTGVFQVDVAADGRSDRVAVSGEAALGQANTVAVAATGDWAASTRYTLLTANDGVSSTFAGATSNLAFLDPTLSYDANNVYLTMARNDVPMPDIELAFPDVVVNPNQKAVAGAVEALGEGNAVYDAVVRLEVPQVVPAFDSLSGEVHAAHRGTLLQNRFLHDGIDRHLDGRAVSGDIAPGVRVWLAGSGGQRRTDATANSTGTRVSQDGLMAGAGWQVGEALELGVAAGQQRLETRLRSGNGEAETDSTEYGVYAAYQWQGLRLRGGVTRADYRTDSTRTAQVGSTLSETLTAREDATGTTAFVRAGWTFGAARLQLTPEIELAQVNLDSDGSQERGGNSALVIGAADSDYRTGVAALKADWGISGGQRDRAVLTARVGWQYADGDRLPVADARFVAGTRDFSIAGTPLARSTALAQLGVAISPSANSRVSLQVQGRRGGDQRELGAQLDWSVGF